MKSLEDGAEINTGMKSPFVTAKSRQKKAIEGSTHRWVP